MAKLSARGRTEVYRVENNDFSEGKRIRVEVALMSDRNVLRKVTWYKPVGGFDFDSGWKVAGKLKESVSPERWLAAYEQRGYTRA